MASPIRSASFWGVPLAAGLIVLAGLAAYHNSFSGPFIYDDAPAILDNPSIRHLWPPWQPLSPPHGEGLTIEGRPILNLSFAVNYALGGLEVHGYHAVNLAIHLCAALALFGIVRRTLRQPVLSPGFDNAATSISFLAALWWELHPLQTEAVTYIVQRAEALMGLFYLLTLYAAIRAMASPRPWRWGLLAFSACLAGMASKEVMVTAPALVFLYDRTFVAGSFRAAWQRHRWIHCALFATWLPLGWLVVANGNRGGTAGFDVGVAAWTYWLTQLQAIAYYLKLSLWPSPLVFDYGTFWLRPADAAPYALIVAPLIAATLMALWRRPAVGFLGAWFLAILAPTSLVPGTIQMIVEHRMYLPLAAILVPVAVGAHAWMPRAFLPVGLSVAGLLGGLTTRRIHDYRSAVALWEDTVAKRPTAARAHSNLGAAIGNDPERFEEAILHFRQATHLAPDDYAAYSNLGLALLQIPGRSGEAVAFCEKAVALRPNAADALTNLGTALAQDPARSGEAIERFRQALRLKPDSASAHSGLGAVLLAAPGRSEEAMAHLETALRLAPDNVEARVNLAEALSRDTATAAEAVPHLYRAEALHPAAAKVWNNIGVTWARIPGRQKEAIAAYESAIRLNPDAWDAHLNLAALLQSLPDRATEAIGHLETVVKLSPDNMDARTNLGLLLADQPDRLAEAVRHFEVVARANPNSRDARYNLGTALLRIPDRRTDAIAEFQAALQLDPADAETENNLGLLYSQMPGRTADALTHLESALRLKPNLAEAHFNIAKLLASVSERVPEAIRHLEQALAASPDYQEAHQLLTKLKAPR